MMEIRACQRVQAELKEYFDSTQEDTSECPIKIEMVGDLWSSLKGTIAGPLNSSYEGGTFELEIRIPHNYPRVPPLVRFVTKVWHPNVSHQNGEICIDILKNAWRPAMTIKSVLLTLQQFLATPNVHDPLDMRPSRQLRKFPDIFKLTAQHWTALYAKGPQRIAEYDDVTSKLVDMGVDEDQAIALLSSNNWDMTDALAFLNK